MSKIVPANRTGTETNFEHSFQAPSQGEALAKYELAKQRLLNVNSWDLICGAGSSVFRLTDESGNETTGLPKKGYHFKIDVPGPGSSSGEGFDWVRIEEIRESSEDFNHQAIAIKVRPCSNPENTNEDTAHFFTDEATSTFMVKRVDNLVTAGVYGRNEKPNTDADKLTDKIRNTVFGIGALAGAAKLQWESLVKGLLS